MKPFVAVATILAGLLFANPLYAQGKTELLTGTVVDTYCHVTMNMGGKNHRQCAATCARNGSPLAIREERTGTLYLAVSQKDMLYAGTGLERFLEERVSVRGKIYERDGVKMILVESATSTK